MNMYYGNLGVDNSRGAVETNQGGLVDLFAASGGGGTAMDQNKFIREEEGYSPLGAVTLANDSDGVALEASLAGDLLDVDVEEAGEPLGVGVLGRLEGVAALDRAGVALVIRRTGEDRGGDCGDGKKSSELEHGELKVG